MSHRTLDRESTLAVHTTEDLGESRALTREGFLLCKNVPIARAGWMIYGPGEVPVEPGTDGLVRIYRSINELANPTTISSFEGKPLVNEHPDRDVDPKTWRLVAVGHLFNVRRGEGENDDCLVADFLITDERSIAEVNSKPSKREVSAGYEADYEQIAPGEGRQTDIMGNHVALVMKGRCGPRCSIGDHAVKEPEMAGRVRVEGGRTPRVSVVAGAVRKIFRDAEADALEAMGMASSEAGGDDDDLGGGDGDTHIHIHAGGGGEATPAATPAADPGAGEGAPAGDLESRVAALESGISQILQHLQGNQQAPTKDDVDGTPGEGAPPPKADEEDPMKAKTGDSAALATSYQALIADAEVLVPGFRVPTFDAAATRATTIDRMCAMRRKALDSCNATTEGATLLSTVSGAQEVDLEAMDCGQVATLFTAAAGARRLMNNTRSTADAHRVPVQTEKQTNGKAAPASIRELNSFYDKYYANGGRAH